MIKGDVDDQRIGWCEKKLRKQYVPSGKSIIVFWKVHHLVRYFFHEHVHLMASGLLTPNIH